MFWALAVTCWASSATVGYRKISRTDTVRDSDVVNAAAARAANVPLMILATSKADAMAYRKLGATTFMVASDHNFLKSAATVAIKDYRALDG